MNVSVIIRIRRPDSWLDQALTGYALQTRRDFEVIIADEGGLRSTSELVAGRTQGYPVPLRHVRPGEGDGRQVLDQSIRLAAHGYVLLTNSDCIPCRDFVGVHASLAGRGRFLCGRCCRVNGELGRQISRNDIVRGRCFEPEWLQAHGRMAAADRRRLGGSLLAARLLDAVTPAAAVFNACNASAWKDDLLAACDGDAWAGGLGGRLQAQGVRGRRIRGRAVCLHLGHERGLTGESLSSGPAVPIHDGEPASASYRLGTPPRDDAVGAVRRSPRTAETAALHRLP